MHCMGELMLAMRQMPGFEVGFEGAHVRGQAAAHYAGARPAITG